MNTITGDLITLAKRGMFDVIFHGCNCFCNCNGGIAREITAEFPEAKTADDATKKGDRSKLGTISHVLVQRPGMPCLLIINAYSQYYYGGHRVNLDYAALRSCLKHIRRIAAGLSIGYPKIGAGLAGGDWNKIAPIIEEELRGEDHTLVVLPEGGGK